MNETITISMNQLATVILAVFAAIVTIGKGLEYIKELITALKKPETEQNDRLKEIENRVEKVENRLDEDHDLYMRYFEHDKTRLNSVRTGMNVLIKAMLATISHALNDNDIDALKDAQSSIQEYLTERVGDGHA